MSRNQSTLSTVLYSVQQPVILFDERFVYCIRHTGAVQLRHTSPLHSHQYSNADDRLITQLRQLSGLAYIISPHADHHHRPVCHNWLTTVQCIISLSLFGPGTNPWAKVHQRVKLPATHTVYHPTKFYRPASIRAGDIRDKYLRTNKVD